MDSEELYITHVCAHDPSASGVTCTETSAEDLIAIASKTYVLLCQSCSDTVEAGFAIDLARVPPIVFEVDSRLGAKLADSFGEPN